MTIRRRIKKFIRILIAASKICVVIYGKQIIHVNKIFRTYVMKYNFFPMNIKTHCWGCQHFGVLSWHLYCVHGNTYIAQRQVGTLVNSISNSCSTTRQCTTLYNCNCDDAASTTDTCYLICPRWRNKVLEHWHINCSHVATDLSYQGRIHSKTGSLPRLRLTKLYLAYFINILEFRMRCYQWINNNRTRVGRNPNCSSYLLLHIQL